MNGPWYFRDSDATRMVEALAHAGFIVPVASVDPPLECCIFCGADAHAEDQDEASRTARA